jgi:hypothetical protein
MVYFPMRKCVMVSDDMSDGNPVIDWANGGSWVEWSKALDGVLKLDFENRNSRTRRTEDTRGSSGLHRIRWILVIEARKRCDSKPARRKNRSRMQVKPNDLAPWNLNASVSSETSTTS